MSLKEDLKKALANEVERREYLQRSLKQAHSTILRLSIEKQKNRAEIAELKRRVELLIKEVQFLSGEKEKEDEIQEK